MARDGPVEEAVLELARRLRVSLVAMTTHGRSGWKRLRFGSTAESVLRACACPMLLVRGEG